MSYKFSEHSKKQLSTLHPDLQILCEVSINIVDFKIYEGYRSEQKQNEYFEEGTSKLKYPNSKHNNYPSLAMDLYPYIDGNVSLEQKDFGYLAGQICAVARFMDINLVWGGQWKNFIDLPHFELGV